MGSASVNSSDLPRSKLRLAKVLAVRKEKEGSYLALARAISEANGVDTGPDPAGGKPRYAVDRRKLKSIVANDPKLVLSIAELQALDRYLDRYGEGLASSPLFVKPDILQSLADSGHVTFLLGSKPEIIDLRVNRLTFAYWDVLAMGEIQRGVYSFSPSIRFDICEVRLPERVEQATDSVEHGDWTGLLDEDGPSLVCIGSSRAIPAAEAILSAMCECKPFQDGSLDEKRQLPFHFVWPAGLHHVFPSPFHFVSGDIAQTHYEAAEIVSQENAAALVTHRGVYVDELSRSGEGATYGVCVAQRRRRGQVWLVLAGISGVATYAAALLLRTMATRIQAEEAGRDSAIYWTVVQAIVKPGKDHASGGPPEVTTQSTVSGPHTWSPNEMSRTSPLARSGR